MGDRTVRATLSADELRQRLGGPLPERGDDPTRVIDALAEAGRTGTVASQGPRYFGFVTGGSVPAAIAADWREVIARVQEEGTCWVGATKWHGQAAMRISISNWSTTAEDIDRSAAAILAALESTHDVIPRR